MYDNGLPMRTLGVMWNSANDCITYAVKQLDSAAPITKRSISSEIAKIYDPLGLLEPVIILAKMLWDESLPINVHTEWMQYYTQLPLLNNVIFHRRTIISNVVRIEMHGFCDASEKAYGACVYLRSTDSYDQVETNLLMAKSKVAPLKSQSILRLELCGALLLTSIIQTARQALHLTIDRTVFWTDSTIVLHWLKTSPHLLKTFVANRVSEIQSRTSGSRW